jgi:hypothetical protein
MNILQRSQIKKVLFYIIDLIDNGKNPLANVNTFAVLRNGDSSGEN